MTNITLENMKNEMYQNEEFNFKDEWFNDVERVNKELIKQGASPLLDFSILKQIAAIRSGVAAFKPNTLPPVPEGKECIIDITGRNPPRIVDAEPTDEFGLPISTTTTDDNNPIPPYNNADADADDADADDADNADSNE